VFVFVFVIVFVFVFVLGVCGRLVPPQQQIQPQIPHHHRPMFVVSLVAEVQSVFLGVKYEMLSETCLKKDMTIFVIDQERVT